MRDHAIDGCAFFGQIELAHDQQIGDLGPGDGAAGIDEAIVQRQVIFRAELIQLVLRCPTVAPVQRGVAIVQTDLHIDRRLGEEGVEIGMGGQLLFHDPGHGAGYAPVFDRGHLAAVPVFIADLEPRDPGRAVEAVQRVAEEVAQGVFVNGGKTVAIGIRLLAELRAGGQHDHHRSVRFLRKSHELGIRQQRLIGPGDVMLGHQAVRIGQIEIPFCQ